MTDNRPANWLKEIMYGASSFPVDDYSTDRMEKHRRHAQRCAHNDRHIVTNIRHTVVDGYWCLYYLKADIHGLRCPSYGVEGLGDYTACQMPEGHDGEHSGDGFAWDTPFDSITELMTHSKARTTEEAGGTK